MKKCTVKHCKRNAIAKGLCRMHYMKLYHHDNLTYVRPKKVCNVPQCNRPYLAEGYCMHHYNRYIPSDFS